MLSFTDQSAIIRQTRCLKDPKGQQRREKEPAFKNEEMIMSIRQNINIFI